MKLGEGGEAFFVFETRDTYPRGHADIAFGLASLKPSIPTADAVVPPRPPAVRARRYRQATLARLAAAFPASEHVARPRAD